MHPCQTLLVVAQLSALLLEGGGCGVGIGLGWGWGSAFGAQYLVVDPGFKTQPKWLAQLTVRF